MWVNGENINIGKQMKLTTNIKLNIKKVNQYVHLNENV